jgi:D-alanine-D-alanine ligase
VSAAAGVVPVVLSPSVQHHGLLSEPAKKGLFGGKTEITRVDVLFPTVHGSHGEDGTLQGLFELADIPYVGCGVLASAVANDKVLCKAVLKQAGVPVVDCVSFSRAEWEADPDEWVERITAALTYPLFVKPATLGSSIGVARVTDELLLRASIDVATNLDRRILVESAVTDCVEINCAVLGDAHRLEASVLEQPVAWETFLTYDDKYLSGGEGMKSAQRVIPAPLDAELTAKVQATALAGFRAIDGCGTARIDFLVKPTTGEVILNEINTLPGSLSFYLWAEMGMPAREVVERLIGVARDAHAEKRRSSYNYRSNLLALTAARGLKGTKGSKRA